MPHDENRLGSYDEVMGTPSMNGNGAPAFSSDDPETMQAATEEITTGPNGGLCHDCVHLDENNVCHAFGGDLAVDPSQVEDCERFRPKLGGNGAATKMGGPTPMLSGEEPY